MFLKGCNFSDLSSVVMSSVNMIAALLPVHIQHAVYQSWPTDHISDPAVSSCIISLNQNCKIYNYRIAPNSWFTSYFWVCSSFVVHKFELEALFAIDMSEYSPNVSLSVCMLCIFCFLIGTIRYLVAENSKPIHETGAASALHAAL